MRFGYIYRITCTTNNMFIIGSSIHKHRYNQYLCNLRKNRYSNKVLQNCYNKYGENSFKFEILQANIPEDILIDVENIWIGANCAKLSDRKKGMNVHNASKTKPTLEGNKKISEKLKGRIVSQEVREKISKATKGKILSKETIKKIKATRIKNGGYKVSQETKDYYSKLYKGVSNKDLNKPIIQMDLKGNFIREWISAQQADKEGGFAFKGVSKAVTGYRPHYKKFKWKFKEKNNK